MIPLPFWLTNVQFVIGAFGSFAFFAAAWLNVDSWAARKEFKTGLRALGFLILAIWSALHGIGLEATVASVVSAIALAVGSLAIAVSYVIDKPPPQPKDLVLLRKKQQEEKIAKVLRGPSKTRLAQQSAPQRNAATADKPHPPKPGAPLTVQPKTPTTPPAPAQASITPKKMTTRRPVTLQSTRPASLPAVSPPSGGAKAGLRTEALVKLPKIAKRRKTRLIVGLFSLFVILAILGTVGYLLYNKSLAPPAEPEPQLIIEVSPEPPPAEEDLTEEETTLEEQAKSTVTIQETETGFLNVRDGASVATPIITQINPGESYELLEENEAGDWYKIQVDDNTAGWIAARYVEKNEE